MDSAMSIAASGMMAAQAGLAASASNIANMQAESPVPAAGTSMTGGGVQAAASTAPRPVLAYDPSAPFANLQGMVATPNVDLAAEAVNQITASIAFKANLAAFKAAESNYKALIEALA